MFLDSQLLLSDAQALTATAVSTNTIDTLLATNEIGAGEPMALVFTIDTAADAVSGDETYQFQLIQSANANLSSQDVLLQTDTAFITRSVLTAGFKVVIPVPAGMKTKRYLGARYVLAGTTPSVTVTAFLQPLSMVQMDNNYPDSITIS